MPFHPRLACSIETSRLILRELVLEDSQGMFELDSDEETQKFLGKDVASNIEESIGYIKMVQSQYEANGIGRWAMILKETGEFIGWNGIKIEHDVNGFESFYDFGARIISRHFRHGYTHEASVAVLDHAFKVLNIDKIHAYIEADNTASIKLVEKLGFKYDGTFFFEGLDNYWYTLTKSDWID